MSFVEHFAADGWVPVRGIFNPSFVDELRREFENQLESLMAGGAGRDYLEVGDRRAMLSPQLKGPFLDERVYGHPLLLKIVQQLLGSDVLIDNITCTVALPGAKEQHLHRDHPLLFHELKDSRCRTPPYAVSLVVPLVDLTPETGTTRIFPGGMDWEEPTTEAALPYIARGECFLMDLRMWHQGTPNLSANPRPVLYIVYARPWFTDSKNLRFQPRINIDPRDITKIPQSHRYLFRRLAAKGAIDASEEELLGSLVSTAEKSEMSLPRRARPAGSSRRGRRPRPPHRPPTREGAANR